MNANAHILIRTEASGDMQAQAEKARVQGFRFFEWNNRVYVVGARADGEHNVEFTGLEFNHNGEVVPVG